MVGDKKFNTGPWKKDNVEVKASRVIAGNIRSFLLCVYVLVHVPVKLNLLECTK